MVLDKPNDVRGYVLALMYLAYLLLEKGLVAGIRVAHEAHWAGAVSGMVFEGIRLFFRCRMRIES